MVPTVTVRPLQTQGCGGDFSSVSDHDPAAAASVSFCMLTAVDLSRSSEVLFSLVEARVSHVLLQPFQHL